jgi:hypothetical protein
MASIGLRTHQEKSRGCSRYCCCCCNYYYVVGTPLLVLLTELLLLLLLLLELESIAKVPFENVAVTMVGALLFSIVRR